MPDSIDRGHFFHGIDDTCVKHAHTHEAPVVDRPLTYGLDLMRLQSHLEDVLIGY